jgi:hypothetical protein
MIAANVGHALVVQPGHRDFNVKRLECYPAMVTDGGADAGILVIETDLVESGAIEAGNRSGSEVADEPAGRRPRSP